ncbi:MAG: protein translocase subunit SecF [Vicinamibacteria bacterium]|jgi:preprotein translocase subunit SecF|nr:protein translocase subunit SecF [Vicinamibacteria bacterium]
MEILKNPNFDFLGKARVFVTLSALLVIAALVLILRPGGLRYGVEFSGGTQLIVRFQNPPEIDRIRAAVEPVAPGAVIQTYGQQNTNQVLVRIGGSEGEAVEVGGDAQRALSAIAAQYPQNPVRESSSEIVGPIVGEELRRKAVQLTVLGLLFQLIYIGFRFKGAVWGAGATLAAFHDVIITLGLLSLLGYEITLNVIAALLTLVGYSVNDTIVIFDRAREILHHRRREGLRKILNDALNQTLSRTIISNGTTFLAVLGLYLFGGEVLRSFGFAMVVGILIGTYSTVYIASPIVIWWHERRQGASVTRNAA